MRVPMIAGNWKMNTTVEDAVKLVKTMLPELDEVGGVEKVVCPPFVSLAAVKDIIEGSSVKLGAQNVFYKEKGAYTGEISPGMLAGLCEYVIIGHSERRQYFGETEEIIDKKIKIAVENLLKPIFCIGESLEENEVGRTEEVLTRQCMASCDRLYFFGGIVIAYEPVWAIGTGRSATAEEANKTIGFIRQLVRHRHGDEIADAVLILYGGSVTASNIAELMKMPEIDGALVGGASLKADDFLSIAQQASEIRGVS
ncbi:MAG TPA: triose-phosphate isomerase [Dehalococcoidales bacterium]|nr:triose-phosphate isomerase [Dehalococcoidales bacterium]